MTRRHISPSGVLRSTHEISTARGEAEQLGLCPSPDQRKYWDNIQSIRAIEAAGIGMSEPIVDLGCRSGILLTWLHQRGYRSLHGCDVRAPLPPLWAATRARLWRTVLAGTDMYARNARRMHRAPVERTGFPPSNFAAATCMSVVEHGVDTAAFFAEVARILKPEGLLLLSTDYWPEKIDIGSLRRFAEARANDRILDRAELEALCGEAMRAGFRLEGDPDLTAQEAPIASGGFRYTFAFLAFRR
jgi:SAM-dependent methyltransferase